LIRPAAYCGAVGYKPSAGLFPLDGVTPLARSFDTVGVIARDVTLARRAFDVLVPGGGGVSESTGRPRAIFGLWNGDVPVAPDWQRALDDAGAAMDDLAHVTTSRLPADVDRIVAAHRSIMCAEAFAAHQDLLRDKAEMLRPKFRAGLEVGRAAQVDESAARRVLDDARHAFWGAMKDTDLILTLPVPDGAPRIDGTTGFQDWLTPWTVMGGPLICLPWGVDSLSLPRSVMLAAHPGQDLFLLEMAARLEPYAPDLPPPQLPL
jgi:Asp-tRNA(Asn)/Glu-tRNA(Gln) amidotransferase A subunit family amidase